MAHAMSITDGTTTFSLSTTNAWLQKYVPVEPTKDDTSVTETIDLTFYGASTSAMQTAIQTLGRLLDTMRRRRQLGVGPAVYLQWQPDGDATTWRSMLLDARIEYQEDTLNVYGQAKMPASISLERVPYWEGALTQLPLTNANGSNNTSGLTVWNHDDGGTGHDNYAAIAAADVTGTIPAPVKVELTNNTGSSVRYDMIYMACNAFGDPANFPHVQDVEGIATGGYGSSTGNDAACSNGQYVSYTVAGDGGYHQQPFDLSASFMQYAGGYDYHIIARLNSYTAPLYCRPDLYDNGFLSPLRRGVEVGMTFPGSAVVDLGVLPMPPGGNGPTWNTQKLVLNWRSDSAQTVQLDFLAFFPAASFRRLYCAVTTLTNNGKITDDPIEDTAYMQMGSYYTPGVVRNGAPLMVWPNRVQRLYFLWSKWDFSAPIDQTFSVKAWYRPRRLSF